MSQQKTFLDKIIQFSQETTIHGFPLIFANNRHFVERIFWIVMVSSAAFGSYYLSYSNLDRFNANPTVVSIQKDFRNWMNPLPAVTGCLKIRADGDLMDELIESTTSFKSVAMKETGRFCNKFKYFAAETSIHGFPLIFAADRHYSERVFWVVVILMAVGGASYYSYSNLDHYNANPTVVSIQKDFRNWLNPLPAVTGCLTERSDETLINDTILEKWNINDTDPKFDYYFQFLKLVTNMSFSNLYQFSKYENDESLNNENLLELADKIHPRISGILVTSETEGTMKNGLTYIYTEKGICFSINSNYSKFMAYPSSLATEPPLNMTTSIYCHYLNGLCYARFDNSPVSDVNYFIHSPMDTVHGAQSPSLILHLSEELEVNFRMQETRSAASLRRLNPKQRQCRFSDEPLPGSPFFSTSMCYMDCRARLSLELCGCIPQYYHFLELGKKCDIKGLVCLSQHSAKLTQPPTKLGCNCPQPCNIVTYFSETPKSTKWKSGYFDQRMTFRWGLLPPTTRFYRDVLFSFEDLVVSIGGTVALFLGISFLTVAEIVFFVLENILGLCFRSPGGKQVKPTKSPVKKKENRTKRKTKQPPNVNIIQVGTVRNRNLPKNNKLMQPPPPDYDSQFIAFNNQKRYSYVPHGINIGLEYNRFDGNENNEVPPMQRLTLYSHNNHISHIPFRH